MNLDELLEKFAPFEKWGWSLRKSMQYEDGWRDAKAGIQARDEWPMQESLGQLRYLIGYAEAQKNEHRD